MQGEKVSVLSHHYHLTAFQARAPTGYLITRWRPSLAGWMLSWWPQLLFLCLYTSFIWGMAVLVIKYFLALRHHGRPPPTLPPSFPHASLSFLRVPHVDLYYEQNINQSMTPSHAHISSPWSRLVWSWGDGSWLTLSLFDLLICRPACSLAAVSRYLVDRLVFFYSSWMMSD